MEATQEPLPNKSAGIVVLFRAFVIEERAKTGCQTGKLLRAHSLSLCCLVITSFCKHTTKRSRCAIWRISITDITYSTTDGDDSVVTVATKNNEVMQYQTMTPFNTSYQS